MRRMLCSVLPFLLLVVLASSAAGAQEATPTDGFVTPDPDVCLIEPRTIEEIKAFLANAPASPEAASATPQLPETPLGTPADQETVDAITAVAYDLYACYNANDFLRVFAFFTDHYMATTIAAEDINPDAINLFATPIPAQDEDARFSIAVRDVLVQEDGRIVAVIVSRFPLGDGSESASTYIFVEQDGRYVIDEVILPPFQGE